MNERTRREAGQLADTAPYIGTPLPPLAEPAPGRHWWRLPLMLSLPLLLIAAGAYLWLTGGKTVSTDNAQIGMHVVNMAPEVPGRIVEVRVTENQRVRAGDLLYRIDPEPYRIALLQADAAVAAARADVARMAGDYQAKSAGIGESSSDVELARQNFERQAELLRRGFTTRAGYDAARSALASAVARRASAVGDAAAARASLAGGQANNPQIAAALAAREKAAYDLARTEIHAPIDGIAVQTDKLNVGALAVPMLPNVTVVGGGGYWVEANFKETQLARIRPGQHAEVEIDAIRDQRFGATVTGIGSGTGSEFSVLPAQNATGNWVKVTQRVPVRLSLDRQPDRALIAGTSATVTVHVAD